MRALSLEGLNLQINEAAKNLFGQARKDRINLLKLDKIKLQKILKNHETQTKKELAEDVTRENNPEWVLKRILLGCQSKIIKDLYIKFFKDKPEYEAEIRSKVIEQESKKILWKNLFNSISAK